MYFLNLYYSRLRPKPQVFRLIFMKIALVNVHESLILGTSCSNLYIE